jgi:glycosyltransferase involved in cell wall biosynthesis
MKLSVVILTKNEKSNIKDCIKSVPFADELLVIDDNSKDNTVDLAKGFGARVIIRALNENYASQKNFALREAKYDWVMFIDADERITKELEKEILTAIKSQKYSSFQFKRMDLFLGKWLKYGDVGAYRDIRLMKKGSGSWLRKVHEYFEAKGEVGTIENPICHYSHPTIEKLMESVNRWSSWHAAANREEKKHSNIIKIVFWPKLKFIDNYVLKFGFLDGVHGFVFSIFMSFHSFLAWSSLWLLQKKK